MHHRSSIKKATKAAKPLMQNGDRSILSLHLLCTEKTSEFMPVNFALHTALKYATGRGLLGRATEWILNRKSRHTLYTLASSWISLYLCRLLMIVECSFLHSSVIWVWGWVRTCLEAWVQIIKNRCVNCVNHKEPRCALQRRKPVVMFWHYSSCWLNMWFVHIWRFPKLMGTSKSSISIRISIITYKPSIFEYPHVRKHMIILSTS